MSDWYKLNPDKTVTKFETLDEYITWRKANPETVDERRVRETRWGPFWISTVFLGLDHRWDEGEPILFETMVFLEWPLNFSMDMSRCRTWDEAVDEHKEMVARVKTVGFWMEAVKRIPAEIAITYRLWAGEYSRLMARRVGR